jgi:hypothetical protein
MFIDPFAPSTILRVLLPWDRLAWPIVGHLTCSIDRSLKVAYFQRGTRMIDRAVGNHAIFLEISRRWLIG